MKIFFLLTVTIFLSGEAIAACQTIPNCTDLGFTMTAAECAGGAIKCPWNTALVYCRTLPKIGDILYSDFTTSADIISGKAAIGIVFDTDKRLAVALLQSGYLSPGGYNTEIPGLANCGAIGTSGNTDYNGSFALSCSTDGKANTEITLAFAKSSGKSFPAAEFCNNHTTAGTAKGDWFLPSIRELKQLIDNKAAVNTGLNKLGKNSLYSATTSYSGSCGYWSSNQADEYAQWYYTTEVTWAKKYNGGTSSTCGYGYFIARPIIQF